MVKFNNILKNRGGVPANSLSACVCRAHALCNAFSDLYLKTPANQKSHFKNPGFTLTEILLAIAIVGLIAALVLPAMVTNYQNRALELGFNRELNALNETVRGLAVTENKLDFFSTIMYSDSEPEGYDETSGKFVKKYLKVSKYCGDNNGDCFAEKYYNYNDSTHKKEVYEPVYKGACASLKNGASICITPQVGGTQIAGFLDINGKKGPNILNRDLRPFTIDINTEKTSLSKTTTEVLSTPETDLKLGGACEENSLSKECCDTRPVAKGDPCCIHYQSKVGHPCYEAPEPPKSACEIDPNGLDCCRTKTISSPEDPCCLHDEIKQGNGHCNEFVNISLKCTTGTWNSFDGDFWKRTIVCKTSSSPSVNGFQTSNGAIKYSIGQTFTFGQNCYKKKNCPDTFNYRLWYNGNQILSQTIKSNQWGNYNVKYNLTRNIVVDY